MFPWLLSSGWNVMENWRLLVVDLQEVSSDIGLTVASWFLPST